jgi:tRNA/tmRNA/rRNA uracil-C5-methylase (TrmA/RlmC/RlmD family)
MIAYTFHLQTEYQLRDFERALALREVVACLQKNGVPNETALDVSPQLYDVALEYGDTAAISPYALHVVEQMPSTQMCVLTQVRLRKTLVRELAYIERVEGVSTESQHSIIPAQVYINRLPKMVGTAGEKMLPGVETLETVRCNKREHGYLSHSFHAYKGKYYPQLVGAIMNVCGIQPGDWVLEPFAGSGTTMVECAMRGVNAVGIDMNPLARLIADVKTSVVREPYILPACDKLAIG